ncbi:DUF6107 family protein [Aurantimonas sp. Leaf443]|uniref:DUF6107 family protein n=1 Tax=Aurantimonas sp. Leaf443 TaxID=1736378 RepID=UPI0006F99E78|nr:DUF6107 family protein [Aurantimonas sp. Leaf443]KQT88231.1 hypothetical protein ASG48_01995 [Aurantimonas sp. Leaf443]
MSNEPLSELAFWTARLAGAAAGSAISVAYLLPHTRREAATRFLIGVVTGLVFGPPAGLMLAERFGIDGVLSLAEVSVMGSAAASLSAWWALGILSRLAAGVGRRTGGEGDAR